MSIQFVSGRDIHLFLFLFLHAFDGADTHRRDAKFAKMLFFSFAFLRLDINKANTDDTDSTDAHGFVSVKISVIRAIRVLRQLFTLV